MSTSEEYTVSSTKGAMTIGAITAGVMLILSVFNASVLTWIIFTCGIYFGMRTYRRVLGGGIVYFKALNMGFKTAFFASLIIAFFAYMLTQLDSSMISTFLDTAEEQLTTSGLPSVMVENAMQYWREALTPTKFGAIIILMYTATGGLISLLLAIFVRNSKKVISG
jgi:hypothetical protein